MNFFHNLYEQVIFRFTHPQLPGIGFEPMHLLLMTKLPYRLAIPALKKSEDFLITRREGCNVVDCLDPYINVIIIV